MIGYPRHQRGLSAWKLRHLLYRGKHLILIKCLMYPFLYDFSGLFTRIIPVVGFKIYGSYDLLRSFFSRRRFIFDNRDFSRGCGFFFANFLIFLGILLYGHTFLGHYVGILHCLLGNFCGTVAIVLFKEKYKRTGYSGGADRDGGVNPPPVAFRGADG